MAAKPGRNPNNNHTRFEDQDYVNRKNEIRDKARGILLRHGYRKTTMEDIGKSCGLGKAALYHYFTNKEEILAEVVRAESERMLAKMHVAINAIDDPKAQIVSLVKIRFQYIKELLIGSSITSEELTEFMPKVRLIRQEYFDKEAKILEKILDEGMQRGIFRKIEAGVVSLILISALQGVEIHFAELTNAPELEKGIDVMFNIFFKGLSL